MTLYIHQKNLLVNIEAEIFIVGKSHIRMTLAAHLHTPALADPHVSSQSRKFTKMSLYFS